MCVYACTYAHTHAHARARMHAPRRRVLTNAVGVPKTKGISKVCVAPNKFGYESSCANSYTKVDRARLFDITEHGKRRRSVSI